MAKYTANEVMDGLKELHNAVAFGFTQAEKRSQERDSALQAQMNRRFDRVDDRFDEVRADISDLKTDVNELKTAIIGLKTDMGEIKGLVRESKRRKR